MKVCSDVSYLQKRMLTKFRSNNLLFPIELSFKLRLNRIAISFSFDDSLLWPLPGVVINTTPVIKKRAI